MAPETATEVVVNAAGLWAKQVGRMVGVELPVSPLKHHYLISDSIPLLDEVDFEMPMTVDLEGFTYMRQDQKGILIGKGGRMLKEVGTAARREIEAFLRASNNPLLPAAVPKSAAPTTRLSGEDLVQQYGCRIRQRGLT